MAESFLQAWTDAFRKGVKRGDLLEIRKFELVPRSGYR